ncbi:SCP2 sterol-binding domain-containing protein [Bacillus sp. NPDC077027]|uniref:SCP2 sterol-binding domain-containing protein n=1 Tax=Bacillus sp. NPDC077027 TaxID=3390548 RepID=UPI003D062835
MKNVNANGNAKQRFLLKPLLSSSSLKITFEAESDSCTLIVDERGQVEKLPTIELSDLTFYGEKKEILQLLDGDLSLQQLINRGQVKVKGSFRALLRLEAVLWLTNGFFRKMIT